MPARLFSDETFHFTLQLVLLQLELRDPDLQIGLFDVKLEVKAAVRMDEPVKLQVLDFVKAVEPLPTTRVLLKLVCQGSLNTLCYVLWMNHLKFEGHLRWKIDFEQRVYAVHVNVG